MIIKIPYCNFTDKLQYLWNTSGENFPPSLLTDAVHFNGKTVGKMIANESTKDEITIETEDRNLIDTVTNKKYLITYGTWLKDDTFSYIVIPIDAHLGKMKLVDKKIPRMNPKDILPRLGIYGLDYCLLSMTENYDDMDAFYIYKVSKHGEPTDPKNRIGYVISIHDDYVECLIDKMHYCKICKLKSQYIKFIISGSELPMNKFSVKSIKGLQFIRRTRLWRSEWAKQVFENNMEDFTGNKKFRG